jgi:hypothetical protein
MKRRLIVLTMYVFGSVGVPAVYAQSGAPIRLSHTI